MSQNEGVRLLMGFKELLSEDVSRKSSDEGLDRYFQAEQQSIFP
jgi:hypothetical protein